MERDIIIKHLDGDRLIYTDRACFKNNEIVKEYIAGGSSGEVNVICLKDELSNEFTCDNVVKAINLDDEYNDIEEINSEIAMSEVASSLKLGPKFVKAFRCNVNVETKGEKRDTALYQFIITEKFDEDLGTYLENAKSKEQIISLKKSLLKLMDLSSKYLFYHGDIYDKDNGVNEGNIMLKIKNGICYEAKFIDFSDCKLGVPLSKVKKMWFNIFENLSESYPKFAKYELE